MVNVLSYESMMAYEDEIEMCNAHNTENDDRACAVENDIEMMTTDDLTMVADTVQMESFADP
jgi:hypothetical protein